LVCRGPEYTGNRAESQVPLKIKSVKGMAGIASADGCAPGHRFVVAVWFVVAGEMRRCSQPACTRGVVGKAFQGCLLFVLRGLLLIIFLGTTPDF